MRLSEVLGVRKIVVRNSIITVGLIVTSFLSIIIAIVTFYGQHAGNFLVSVDPDAYTRGIILSEDETFIAPSPRLLASPVGHVKDVTYSWLNLDAIKKADGDYIDPDYKYLAYTFYIKNVGTETIDVQFNVRITDLYKNMDDAIRVLIIEDDMIYRMYKKPDHIPHNYPSEIPNGIHFIDNKTVCEEEIKNFRPNQIKKFSIVIWLEGEDPDCNNELIGGMIKMAMRFIVVGDKK